MQPHPRLTYHGPPDATDMVDIVIVNSRGADNPWFAQALHSAKDQLTPAGVIVVDNNDHALSIGAAYNVAVKHSDAYAVLFLSDDDYISIDLAGFLVGLLARLRQRTDCAAVVLVTSGMTMVDEKNRVLNPHVDYGTSEGMVYLAQHHNGLWLRTYLDANPFDETLAKLVDTEAVERLKRLEKGTGRVRMWASSYHYGYFYRQHIGQVSGKKLSIVKP